MAQITAGVSLDWAQGTGGDTTPTVWTHIPDVTDIPEIGNDVDTYETTSLDNLTNKTYIDALKDTGGAIGVTANDTPEFRTAWKAFAAASKTENGAWIRIKIPAPVNEQMVAQASASSLGFGGAAINGVLTTTANFTITSDYEWEPVNNA